MPRLLKLLVPLACLLTGCYTNIHAPGAVGRVVDADTGAPVRGACITRPSIAAGFVGGAFVPPEGIPTTTVSSDKSGRFDLAPATQTTIRFMYLHNPKSISGSFIVSADGYATNELHGVAMSHLWRVDLGRVLLSRP